MAGLRYALVFVAVLLIVSISASHADAEDYPARPVRIIVPFGPGGPADIGRVETALAVRAGDPLVSADNAISLRAALLATDAIFVPDTRASTAGIHVARVLAQLDIAEIVADRLKVFPNGATAMRHLAESRDGRPIGCTQSTEIISTKGVVLSGTLPPGCGLATMYTAAVATRASNA
ncbi:hypothetical protein [Bradyrhizobium uaiense]|uniref:hypothetical protein n=1 Tax=Bradyrhizobium uaiense TaxID=2594946 RepID=UPI0015835D02|nr:hypothetical protein [Bradyrhizobium uaiense]